MGTSVSLRQPYPRAISAYYKTCDVIHARTNIMGITGLYHINIQIESTKDIQQINSKTKRTTQTSRRRNRSSTNNI